MKRWSKTTYFTCCGILAYAVVILLLLFGLRQMLSGEQPALPADMTLQSQGQRLSLAMQFAAEVPIPEEGLLIPVGPDASRLPGFQKVWAEVAATMTPRNSSQQRRGFDALQAINNPEKLAGGAVYELPLSHKTVDVVRYDHYALLLMSNGTLLILDLSRPERPVVLTSLSLERAVWSLDMQDGVAYLLASDTDSNDASLLIFDLAKPERPRKIAERVLPEGSSLLSLSEGQLLVAATAKPAASDALYHYELDSDYQLTLRGTMAGLDLDEGFFRQGRTLFFDGLHWGVQTIEMQDDGSFGEMDRLLLPDHLGYLTGNSERLFAWGTLKQLYTIDIEDRQAPGVVRVDSGAEYPVKVLFEDDYTYILAPSGWFYVYDQLPRASDVVRSPQATVQSSGLLLPTPGQEKLMLLSGGDLAQLSSSQVYPMELFDLSDLGIPVAADWRKEQLVVLLEGRRLLLLSPEPGGMKRTATFELSDNYRWLKVSDAHAYLGGAEHIRIVRLDSHDQFLDAGRIDLPGKDLYGGCDCQGPAVPGGGRGRGPLL